MVERDEDSSVAYLCAPDGTVHGAVWLANHRPAPPVVDLARLNAGLPPLMPRANTRIPTGRRPLGQLTPLWFEEGDGVALYEDDDLLAVIPGWADMSRGMPGYARDAVGESPFAWALAEALEGLRPRIAKRPVLLAVAIRPKGPGRRSSSSSWAIWIGRLGPGRALLGRRRRAVADRRHHRAAAARQARVHRAVHGRDELPADADRGAVDRPDPARTPGSSWPSPPARIRATPRCCWCGWRSIPGTRSPGWATGTPPSGITSRRRSRWARSTRGCVMQADPPGMPDMSGFAFGGEAVRWLWLSPVTHDALEEQRR